MDPDVAGDCDDQLGTNGTPVSLGGDDAETIRSFLEAQCIKKDRNLRRHEFAGVTAYLQNDHTVEELVGLIDSNWVKMPDAVRLDSVIDNEIVEA